MKKTHGNCLLGSLILLWRKRKHNPKIVIGFRPGTIVPHFIVKTKKYFYHYKTEEDIFPWPFCYLIFKGTFQVLKNDKLYIFEKNNDYK
jgi:hypothetical protein